MKTHIRTAIAILGLAVTTQVLADITVELHAVNGDGVGIAIGNVVISESPYGLVFTPALNGMQAGLHGFHVHENASCEAGGPAKKTVNAYRHWRLAVTTTRQAARNTAHPGVMVISATCRRCMLMPTALPPSRYWHHA